MTNIQEIVRSEYPDAQTGADVTDSYLNLLADEYKSDLSKMLFATSLCSDDINVSTDFRKVLRRPFTLGGLGGFPFAGYTGMVAFSHHIPDGGDAFILYGPHIGITDEGELGRMLRPGQSHLTSSCGALMIALGRLEETDEAPEPSRSDLDYQQKLLERSFFPHKRRILDAENQKKEITEVAYDVIRERLLALVKKSGQEFVTRRLFLLGGVIVNTSPEFHDYVDVRDFEVIGADGLETADPTSILSTDAFKKLCQSRSEGTSGQ